MSNKNINKSILRSVNLLQPTFEALKNLGGSGSNSEILDQVIQDLKIPDEIVDIPHPSKYNNYQNELAYQLAWARTYLSKYGVIDNSTRGIWSICNNYNDVKTLDTKAIIEHFNKIRNSEKKELNNNLKDPDEIKPWRTQLSEILHNMNPYGFERLSQRLLRECGFSQVEVTKKSRDGGIDGFGKLKINGIFSFNVAFQCKRFSGSVSASDIRDFRGSLTTDMEKGVLITTGTFTKAAIREAAMPGKQQIDLVSGEEFITKIAELGIGVKEVRTYEIEEDFFLNI